MTEPMVDARGVRKSINDLDILRGVDFTVARGEVVSLIGPSGSGKSTFLRINTNDIVTPVTAAIRGLALNEGAYMAEIVRAGISSVDHGQSDAARALGMTRLKAMRRIILPQAMRVIIPPTGNETIGMLKMTSLVSVIALSDLLYSAQSIYSRTFETIPLLLVCCCWYLLFTSLLSIVQGRIEAHYGRGVGRAGG